MRFNSLSKFGIAATVCAAGGFLVQPSLASNWCPTSTDYQITCSNCSRELTCDLNGIGIEILGENVTLDGQSHSITDAPYDAVLVANYSGGSANATVKNLYIYDPEETGVRYYTGSDSWNVGHVDNVYSSGAYFSAFDHQTYSPLEIKNSWAYYSLNGVTGSTYRYTDFISSSAAGNSYDGYRGRAPVSYVRYSYFWYNYGGSGADISYATSNWVDNNTFSSNNGTGLNVYSADYTSITNNSGSLSVGYDCVVASSASTSASGNNWGTYSGTGCIY